MQSRIVKTLMALSLCLWLPLAALAQGKSERAYVFGNSLVHHLTQSDETSVPHWLALMAEAGGHEFALSGQWGFLRDFARALPPQPNWSFDKVTPAWRSDRQPFAEAGLTNIWITPANFIQYQSIEAPFDGENAERQTPLAVARQIADWARAQAPQARIYVYEGWPEMAGVTGGFPPSPGKLSEYHAYARGDYAKWYDAFVEELSQSAPVYLIPVSRVLSAVMADTALEFLDAQTFYADDAPHGTSALYLMAAMVVYNMIYGEEVPESFRPPISVAPELRATFPMVRDAIWEEMAYRLVPQTPDTPVAQAAAQEADQEAEPAAAVATAPTPTPLETARASVTYEAQLSNPSLAMGLNGIADWSVQHPFLNVMKSARPWVGHTEGQWGAFDNDALREGGHIGPDGWPRSFPPGVKVLEAFVLTDQPIEASNLAGRYSLKYDGRGEVSVGGLARNVQTNDREITFDYTPGEGLVSVALRRTDPADPIRNMSIVRQEFRPIYEAGARFNPEWLTRIENLRSLRFMDWMATNGSKQTTWDNRPTPDDFSYVEKGVPLEEMIALSNLVGADPWFTMPHMADDTYVRGFAQMVRDTLRPELRSYVEYSNEVWNFIFPQAKYAQEQAKARWGRKASDDAWVQFYGMRAAQIAQIWAEEFGTQASTRLVPVIATHTGWLGLEEAILNAPLWTGESADNWEPYVSFSAYAVTGYFGYEMGGEEGAPKVIGWLEESEAAAKSDAAAKGLTGGEAETYVQTHRYDLANKRLDEALREGSFKELTEVIFPQQAEVAENHGLALVMYEGGTHVAVSGEFSQNEALIGFFKQFNYSPEMAGLYRDLLTKWKEAGGTLFNAFVDVSKPSQYGSWGALRNLQDDNPRWQALADFNRDVPGWWETRGDGVFAGGRVMMGHAEGEELTGTRRADFFDGRGGDDVLHLLGGHDVVLGGDGFDAALLPGAPQDYSFRWEGEFLILQSEALTARLHSVEMLWFESDEELALMVSDLR